MFQGGRIAERWPVNSLNGYTTEGSTFYLHVFDWPQDGRLLVPGQKNPAAETYLLGDAQPLRTRHTDAGIEVLLTTRHIYHSPMGAVELQLVDGGRLEDVNISRIPMENVGSPIFIRLGNRGRTYARQASESQGADVRPEGAPVGTLKNVRIRDVVAEVTIESGAEAAQATYRKLKADNAAGVTDQERSRAGPIMITGVPGHYVADVVLENVKISYPGGGTSEHAKRGVPEDVARYPEQYFFGVLPSWGAYIRHAGNIEFRNVDLQTRALDRRERIGLDDVEGFVER